MTFGSTRKLRSSRRRISPWILGSRISDILAQNRRPAERADLRKHCGDFSDGGPVARCCRDTEFAFDDAVRKAIHSAVFFPTAEDEYFAAGGLDDFERFFLRENRQHWFLHGIGRKECDVTFQLASCFVFLKGRSIDDVFQLLPRS